MDLKKQTEQAAEILLGGGVVAFPTDTIYGLGACYNNRQAVERIYDIKGRYRFKGLPLLLGSMSQLQEVVCCPAPSARLLMELFWPGAVTLVLPRSARVDDIVTGGDNSVAIRIPSHPVPIMLASKTGHPICGTSANVSGNKSLVDASEVRYELGRKVDYIIEGGPAPGGVESTIIDCCHGKPRLIREGAIAWKKIEQAIRLAEGDTYDENSCR